MPRRGDEWIGDDEYPDERDIDDLGDESPPDIDPLTIGYVRNVRQRFWSPGRVVMVVIALLLIAAMVLPEILAALGR